MLLVCPSLSLHTWERVWSTAHMQRSTASLASPGFVLDSLSCVALACSGCPHSSQLPSSPWVTTKASASATSPHPLRRHADSIPNLRVQVGTDLCVDFSPRRSSHTYYCALLWGSRGPPCLHSEGFPNVWKLSLLHSSLLRWRPHPNFSLSLPLSRFLVLFPFPYPIMWKAGCLFGNLWNTDIFCQHSIDVL